jgi:glycosyltransferase involved in cell wall biosynthesis
MATGEYCLVIDADLQIKPIEIKTFIKLLDLYDADVVIGNKRHCYSNVEYPLRRRIVSYCYNLMNRIIFGISLRDTQCGFKLFKKSALDMVMDKVLVKRFAFDLEVMVALHDNKVRIVDAPVYVEKSTSAGSVNAENIFNTLKDTLAVFVRRQKGWYK